MKQTIKNQKLFFISLIGIVVVSLIMGTTFAYQTIQIEKTEGSSTDVTVNVGKLNVTFDLKCKEGEVCDEENDNYDRLNLSNMPLLTSYNQSDYVEFTLNTNDTTGDVLYQINLTEIDYGYISDDVKTSGCRAATNDLQAACLISEDFKYTVVEVTDSEETILSEGNFSDLSGEDYILNLKFDTYNLIEKGKTQTIRLYLWLQETEEEQNNLENTYFNAKIEINSYFLSDVTLLSANIIKNAKSGIEGRAVFTEPEDLPSTPAEEINEPTEAVLSYTKDDYGKSYYFRGNVQDNYVNFAGMCWRIVRIAGDGSTKLILEDQYTTCDDTETEITSVVYTGNWNIGIGNYGYELKNVDTDSYTEYIMNYLRPVTNKEQSMVKAFYDFQTTGKLKDYTDKLKSGDWCLGDNAYTRSGTTGSYSYTLLDEYNYSQTMYYDSTIRLTSINSNGYQPTLKCNGTILNEFADVSEISTQAPMYVSAIISDEIVYAGGIYNTSNYNYYLVNDYIKDNVYFWSLSPVMFNGNDDFVYFVRYDGDMRNYDVDTSILAFRPSVSLSSSAAIISGEGTLEKPYTID